jgi:RNA polymerase primary sigma factor
MADDAPLERSESDALAEHATRGRAADRALADRISHPGPHAGAISAAGLHGERAEPSPALLRAARDGDRDALRLVVEALTPRVAALSRRYAQVPHVERLELIQEGIVGLLEALHRYDPDRGTPFWPYARPTVERHMRRLAGELGDAASLGDNALRRLSRLKSAEDDLMQQRHRLPSRREIAERAGVDLDDAEQLLLATKPPRSFQDPLTADDGGVIGSFGDLIDDPRAQDEYDRVLDSLEAHELLPLLSVLSERERTILSLHYGLDGEELSRRQIAERLGISERRVKDIERRALSKLRRAAAAVGAAR